MNFLKIKTIIAVLVIIGLTNIINAQPLTQQEIDEVRTVIDQVTPNNFGSRIYSTNPNSSQISLYNSSNIKFGSFFGQSVDGDKTFQLRLGEPTGFGEIAILTLRNNKVGIGTRDPQADLDVKGFMVIGESIDNLDKDGVDLSDRYSIIAEKGILSEKVKVAVKDQTHWSDYVFEEDYERLPLEELEDYVTENKHLPKVPSAEEMVANGLDVAKMDAKLLEKIEEAYLYIIDLNKKVDALANENESLKTSLQSLSTSNQ